MSAIFRFEHMFYPFSYLFLLAFAVTALAFWIILFPLKN